MSTSRKDVISRLRNSIKEVSSDSKYPNRYLWNVFWTNSKTLLKQESDRNRLYNQSDIWQTINVQMDKVSPILCKGVKLPMDCVIYRSRFKVPKIAEGNFGRIYRFISTPDLSQQLVLVTPYQYQNKQTKYNQEKYVFFHDGYLWAPNSKWPFITISALFEEEIPKEFKCEDEVTTGNCGNLLHLTCSLPEYLIGVCIQMSLQELGASKQIPADELDNANTNDKGLNER
jgi:hypothetical protein